MIHIRGARFRENNLITNQFTCINTQNLTTLTNFLQISKYFGHRIQQQLLANLAHVQRNFPLIRRLSG